ncbi:hypothetical protein KY495_11590 [Massilia sp. PAMC28688]|uniref:hypothetical protein n=1 Tax=Massilia sp. PAMC28688 TaxID=2861283 RepID=UPI001C62C369|nr:hypothetical protein [Massilia sp. PAMC28688]QYF95733.1 hypothetical protein KY495_11590 [Massilia sp. PAMC28688]
MITLPEHVLESTVEPEGQTWDGHDSVTGHPNKETAMPWSEHQRIVCAAVHLLQGEPPGNADVKKIFRELKSAYVDPVGRSVVRVSKGIHQPTVDPHLQLRTITDWGGGNISYHKFHLNVSAVAVPATDNLDDDRFQWTPVQFTFLHTNNQTYAWPALAVPVEKKGDLKRRLSISDADLKKHVALQLALQRAAEKAKLDKEFNEAVDVFHKAHGGKKGRVAHANPDKDGVFPKANFQGGTNARVIIDNRPQYVHYDPVKKAVLIGMKPKNL